MDATTPSAMPQLAPADADYEPSIEELLKDIPESPPLPKWNDPKLRYMPKGSDEGQQPVTPAEAWRKIHNLVEKYDKGMCESYREQIDTLLVFAGLFSAVVTAFAIESYQWLQDDPADASAELLRQAVILLSTLANQTSLPSTAQRDSALSESVVVRINAYWFLSLVLSLSAALIGIVCKQWLREYERDIGQSAQQALAVRQMKFEGLEAWRVGAIVTSVPLLLQLALALFLVGISELLWHLHRTVAITATAAAGLTGAFYIMTSLAPLWQYLYLLISSRMQMTGLHTTLPGRAFTLPQCPYKSPQAWLALRVCQRVVDYVNLSYATDSWVSFDAYWTARRDENAAETTTSRALAWTAHALGETHLNAWRLLCARQHLAQTEGSMPYRSIDADHRPEALLRFLLEDVDDSKLQAMLRKQAALFSQSCQPDLDVNMSMELLLQLAAHVPYNGLRVIFYGLDFISTAFSFVQNPSLNDDLAVELLRVIRDQLGSDDPSLLNIKSVVSLLKQTVEILDWAPSRTLFLSVLCAVAMRFLQSVATRADADTRARAAFLILERVGYSTLPNRTEDQPLRGFGHIVSLARFMLENDPLRIHDPDTRRTLDDVGLSFLFDEPVPRIRHRDYTQSDAVSGASVAGTDAEPAIELHDIARVSGGPDDAARIDPRLGVEMPMSSEGSSGVINTSSSHGCHIVVTVEPYKIGTCLGAQEDRPTTSISHDPDSEAP